MSRVRKDTTYVIYLVLSLGITYWVGQTLHRNGRVFLVENFQGQEALADSINHLLLVGFYLVNLGFVALALRYGDKPTDLVGAFEFLSTKVGLVVVILGFMHFTNMRLLVRYRASRLLKSLGPTEESTSHRLGGIAEARVLRPARSDGMGGSAQRPRGLQLDA